MRRFLAPRWLARHVAMIVLVVVFLGLGWWQIGRAEQGNVLSYGYSFEWPFFALFVIFVWYREIRIELRDPDDKPEPLAEPVLKAAPPPVAPAVVEADPAADPELTAYNEYLAWLNANPDRRPRDFWKAREAGQVMQPPA